MDNTFSKHCWSKRLATTINFCSHQELDISGENDVVYKLIGPALIQQDSMEARANVKKRLEFISGELDRLDAQLKGYEEKQARKQARIVGLQQEAQRIQQQLQSHMQGVPVD